MELKHINLLPISKLIGHNESVLISLLEDIIKGSERKFADLNQSLKDENWNLIKGNAHFLKSNFRHLGHVTFTELLKKIEDNSMIENNRDEVKGFLSTFISGFDTVMEEVKAYLIYLKNEKK